MWVFCFVSCSFQLSVSHSTYHAMLYWGSSCAHTSNFPVSLSLAYPTETETKMANWPVIRSKRPPRWRGSHLVRKSTGWTLASTLAYGMQCIPIADQINKKKQSWRPLTQSYQSKFPGLTTSYALTQSITGHSESDISVTRSDRCVYMLFVYRNWSQ